MERRSPSHPLAPHRAEVRRRWRYRLRDGWILRILIVVFAVFVFASPGRAGPPPPWWPWFPRWFPGDSAHIPGYLPITMSPRVLAGSVD